MSRRLGSWSGVVALGLVAVIGLASPAGASAPEPQVFEGTLRFCESDCDLGTVEATGPISGTADVEIINDRANHRFSVSHVGVRLSMGSQDSITLALTLRGTGGDDTDPCRVTFTEQGTWRITDGTGVYAAATGEGQIHSDGVAIDHDPTCGGMPYSLVHIRLDGRTNT